MEGTSWWRKESQIPPGVGSGEGEISRKGCCRYRQIGEKCADRYTGDVDTEVME